MNESFVAVFLNDSSLYTWIVLDSPDATESSDSLAAPLALNFIVPDPDTVTVTCAQ